MGDGTCENSRFSCDLQVNAARLSHFLDAKTFLTIFNKIAIQGAPQMAVDKGAISLSRVNSYYSKCRSAVAQW